MNKLKRLGMVHIPGVNDRSYREYLKRVKSQPKTSNNLWSQLP